MPKTTALGDVLPLPGEDLLDAWANFADTARRIIPVSDLGAAALMLDRAATAGLVISTTKPTFFSVGGAEPVQYVCTGKDSTSGGWRLVPFNEPEQKIDTYETSWSGTREFTATSAFSGMMKTSLPVRPYARRVTAMALAYGASTSGYVNLRMQMHDGSYCQSRFTTDDSTVTAIGGCDIPAGETPIVSVGIDGAGKVRLSSAYSQNRLIVTADPIRMTI